MSSILQAIVAVSLGLSVQWASSNCGTDDPMATGDCYRWGEWPELEDGWRVPTKEEFEELMSECKWEWVKAEPVSYYVVTGPSGESIVLPAAGYMSGGKPVAYGKWGYLWSSSNDELMPEDGRGLVLGGAGQYHWYSGSHAFEFPIRPVR